MAPASVLILPLLWSVFLDSALQHKELMSQPVEGSYGSLMIDDVRSTGFLSVDLAGWIHQFNNSAQYAT